MLRAIVLATAIAVVPSRSAAQDHPLVGVWSITFPAGLRVENGVPTTITRTGKLTVVAAGDSLVATLATDPAEGQPPRPAVRLATKAGAGDAVFVQRSKVRINLNGAEQEATATSTWTLIAKGDQLGGNIDRTIEGGDGPSAGPQPLSGSRVKG